MRTLPILGSGHASSTLLPLLTSQRWIQHELKGRGQCRKVRLLVDGDAFGCDRIAGTIASLAGENYDVKATVFVAPGLVKSKRMRELLQRSDISFIQVPRGEEIATEPNDHAIISEMQKCARSPDRECIALMTSDKGFAEDIRQLMSDQQPFMALIPDFLSTVVKFYKEKGIPVFLLPYEERPPKVRAILHADGNGTVELGEAFEESANLAQCQAMYDSWEGLLEAQGCSALFSSSEGYPIQRIAKFWFANGLGSVPVFPAVLASIALDNTLQQEARKWISSTESLAYILPVSSFVSLTKSGLATYGSRNACSVFRGGGPFMLHDSDEMVMQALRKLGYLDDLWNTDLTEALSCFWNTGQNKHKLRKLGIAIGRFETTAGAAAKLRAVLLSDGNDGRWQRGGTRTPDAITILKSVNILPRDSEAPSMGDIWCGLKTYAHVHQLPVTKTFNALAVQVVAHSKRQDPHRRGKIVIQE